MQAPDPLPIAASAADATAARSAAGVPPPAAGRAAASTMKLVPTPTLALDRDRAAVHVDDRAHDRQPEAAAAAARLVGPRAAVEPLEDLRQLVRRRCRRRCRGPRSGRRRRRPRRSTSTEPPRGVNLIALPTRLVTTWPIRCGSWRIRTGASGRSSAAGRRAAGAAAAGLLDRRTRPRPGGRRAGGRAGRAPNRASRARAGSGRASRAARAAGRSSRGTPPAPSGRRRRRSLSSSLKVRSAAIGVRSSCETSARKSRLRSRSRRMISTLSSSWSAIALNWTRELGQLGRAGADVGARARAG